MNSNTSATSSAESRERIVARALAACESPLINYARALVGDPNRARDIVHETFIRFCARETDLAGDPKILLFTTCRKLALESARKTAKIPETPEPVRWKRVAGPELEEPAAPATPPLLRHVEGLAVNQREVIVLMFQQGFGFQEISAITGLTAANAGFLLHTSLRRLRDLMQESAAS